MFAASLGMAPELTPMENMAEWRPDLVQEVYQYPDGTIVDKDGNPVDMGNRVFIPAKQSAPTPSASEAESSVSADVQAAVPSSMHALFGAKRDV